MRVESTVYGSREEWLAARLRDVTSTEVSALFGANPYMSAYKLWHLKAGKVKPDDVKSSAATWGLRMQDVIAKGIAEDNGITIKSKPEYIRVPSFRIGSSFDYETVSPTPGLCLDAKSVSSYVANIHWDIRAGVVPMHIYLQMHVQMFVTNTDTAYVAALIGGNDGKLIKIKRDDRVIGEILNKVSDFWKSVDEGCAPSPDLDRDCDNVGEVYSYAEPGKSTVATETIDALSEQYRALGGEIYALEKKRSEVKAKILMEIGDSESVYGDNYKISAGLVGPVEIKTTRKGYRNFKIFWKKGD